MNKMKVIGVIVWFPGASTDIIAKTVSEEPWDVQEREQ